MITVKIGQSSREWASLDDVQESWIAQQVIERRRSGQPVCVYVGLSFPGIDLGLIAGECPPSPPGPTKSLNEDERKILELWIQRTRRNGRVDPGEINSFFKQLRPLI